MNYMFLFEGFDSSPESEELQKVLFPNADPFVLVLPDGVPPSAPQERLLDSVYDVYSQHSLASLVEETYNTDEHIPFYYFSMAAQHRPNVEKLYAQYGMSMINVNEDKIQLYDMSEQKTMGSPFSIEQCLDKHFGGMFAFSPQKSAVHKTNTNLKLQIQEKNIYKVSQIFSEVCGTLTMSTIFSKSSKPNHVTFHLTSFADLAGTFSAAEIAFVQDLWRITISKVTNNFAANFAPSEVFGETLFVVPG